MKTYGAVVAGAGLGGMTAALYLAGRGIRTLVLEQNHQPGGNMAGFRRGDFYFDGGDQSFESLGIVFPLFEEMGILDKIRFHRARFRMKSPDFDFFVDSFEGVEEALSLAFPREKGIRPLFREIRETSRFIETHCSPWSFPLLHDFSFGRLARASLWLPKFRRWLTYEYRKKACAVLQDERLRNWFTGIGYYKMPFIFFAGFWHLWMKDYWYPEGGMNRLYAVLKERLVELGGEILLGKRLVKIEHSPKRASSFITADGDVFCAERFIYTGDYKRLVREIAPGLFRPSFVRAAEEAKLTEELVSVYLGLDMDREELSRVLGSQHVFYFPNYDVTFPDASSPEDVHAKMWLLVNHFGEENPSAAPGGASSVVLQTYSSRDWQNCWRSRGKGLPRNEDYRSLKAEAAKELVRTAENVAPGLGSRVLFLDAGTPLSSERFTLNSRGSSGGWCYGDRESFVFRRPKKNLITTPLENLFTAGHYSLWPGGVISAALSGKIAANFSCGRRAMERFSS